MKYNQLETYSQRLDAIVENAHDGVISIDGNQLITFMNSAARRMFGYTPQQTEKLKLNQLIPENTRKFHNDHIRDFRLSQERARTMHNRESVLGLRQDGSEFPLEISISKIIVNGKMEMVAVMRDISERSKLIQELKEAATLDHLTKLANKRIFDEEMARQVALANRYNRELSLLIIDIDHFKMVNDKYGHAWGDEVLKSISDIIRQYLRESDIAARWGGEEFALLLPETDKNGAKTLAEKLRVKIQNHHFELQGKAATVTCSFGVFALDDDHQDAESLFEEADRLLYQAKGDGRNCVR